MPRLLSAALLLCCLPALARAQAPGATGACDGLRDAAGGPVFTAKEVTHRAVIIQKPEATYTSRARRREIVGSVAVRVVLGADGRVAAAVPVRELPEGLTERAVEAARAIKFSPAIKDGRAVSQCVTVEYLFNIWPRELSKQARLTGGPTAQYTAEARANKVEGRVALKVELTADGKAVVLEVIQGLPHGLTESAVAAARRLQFTPAMKGKRPVGEIRVVVYSFSLSTGEGVGGP